MRFCLKNLSAVLCFSILGLTNAGAEPLAFPEALGFGANVTHVYFQQDVTPRLLSLGAYAFAEMSSMKICELPTSITQIGNFAFRNDVALKAMNFNWDNLDNINDDEVEAFQLHLQDYIIGGFKKCL